MVTASWIKQLSNVLNQLFEKEVAVFFVATGTAANALALASVNRPGGVVFCHREAHMIEDECGAPEFFTHGARLVPVDGLLGRIDPVALESEINRFPADFIHAGQPMAISITQSTEIGTVYQPDQILEISAIAKRQGLPLHMDGARFANALVALDLSPAQMTWKLGVDIISFGATKNGCWCAEALVFTNPDMAGDLPYIRKRAAQLFSKTRFIASQFDAYLNDDLWLELAAHANLMAQRLADGIQQSSQAHLAWKPETNEVFCVIKQSLSSDLREQGAVFHEWNLPHTCLAEISEDEVLIRLVTSFASETRQIDRFIELLK